MTCVSFQSIHWAYRQWFLYAGEYLLFEILDQVVLLSWCNLPVSLIAKMPSNFNVKVEFDKTHLLFDQSENVIRPSPPREEKHIFLIIYVSK